MNELLYRAAEQWRKGLAPEQIARLLNVTYDQVMDLAAAHPDLFITPEFLPEVLPRLEPDHDALFVGEGDDAQQGDNYAPSTHDPLKGRIPPKAPGSTGVPFMMILAGQCRFPLWGDDETPDARSLMCGEPVSEKGRSYCPFHHKLVYLPTPDWSQL